MPGANAPGVSAGAGSAPMAPGVSAGVGSADAVPEDVTLMAAIAASLGDENDWEGIVAQFACLKFAPPLHVEVIIQNNIGASTAASVSAAAAEPAPELAVEPEGPAPVGPASAAAPAASAPPAWGPPAAVSLPIPGAVLLGSESALPAGQYRFYCVWKIPRQPLFRGVFACREPGAWNRLAVHLPGGEYKGSGARLRRYDTLREACEGFVADRPHGTDLAYRIWTL